MIEKILRLLDKVLSFFETWTLFVTVFVALIALFANVVLRYGFNYSLAWSEELIRIVIVYTTLIGCSAAVKSGTMIKIDALVQIVPRLKIPLSYFSNVVTLIFSGMLVYYGWRIAAMQLHTGQKTVIMEVPYVFIYSFLPLMGAMMGIRTLQVLYRDITGNDVFGTPDEEDAGNEQGQSKKEADGRPEESDSSSPDLIPKNYFYIQAISVCFTFCLLIAVHVALSFLLGKNFLTEYGALGVFLFLILPMLAGYNFSRKYFIKKIGKYK